YNSSTHTMYYKGDTSGNFTLESTAVDAGSGAKNSTFPDISTTGWTHSSEVVTGSSPYTSATFSWTASPTNPSNYTVQSTDRVGNTASATAITFTSDTTGPSISIATGSTSNAYLNTSTNTMYFKGDASGNFTLAATVTDAASGAGSTTYPAISTTDWTHNSETVTGSSP